MAFCHLRYRRTPKSNATLGDGPSADAPRNCETFKTTTTRRASDKYHRHGVQANNAQHQPRNAAVAKIAIDSAGHLDDVDEPAGTTCGNKNATMMSSKNEETNNTAPPLAQRQQKTSVEQQQQQRNTRDVVLDGLDVGGEMIPLHVLPNVNNRQRPRDLEVSIVEWKMTSP